MKVQKITVGGLLIVDGTALIVRRSEQEDILVGYYELPGGKVDFGETPEESLKREFKEETDLDINVLKPYRIFTYITHEDNRHTIEIVYKVELIGDKIDIKLSSEHDDFKWIKKDEINRFKMSEEIKKNLEEGFK